MNCLTQETQISTYRVLMHFTNAIQKGSQILSIILRLQSHIVQSQNLWWFDYKPLAHATDVIFCYSTLSICFTTRLQDTTKIIQVNWGFQTTFYKVAISACVCSEWPNKKTPTQVTTINLCFVLWSCAWAMCQEYTLNASTSIRVSYFTICKVVQSPNPAMNCLTQETKFSAYRVLMCLTNV